MEHSAIFHFPTSGAAYISVEIYLPHRIDNMTNSSFAYDTGS
jgi:hypothetical protein